jgi:hypothetical protein
MSAHPVRADALPEPHLVTTSETFRLTEFLGDSAGRYDEWARYISETEKSLCRLYGYEPSTMLVRAAIVVGLRMSNEFRKFVIDNGGAEEARVEETYLVILEAGAGTIIHQCTERRREGGADVAISR